MKAFRGRCCITGCDVAAALHVMRLGGGKATDGVLLLRRDVAQLVERGLATVTTTGCLRLAPSLGDPSHIGLALGISDGVARGVVAALPGRCLTAHLKACISKRNMTTISWLHDEDG